MLTSHDLLSSSGESGVNSHPVWMIQTQQGCVDAKTSVASDERTKSVTFLNLSVWHLYLYHCDKSRLFKEDLSMQWQTFVSPFKGCDQKHWEEVLFVASSLTLWDSRLHSRPAFLLFAPLRCCCPAQPGLAGCSCVAGLVSRVFTVSLHWPTANFLINCPTVCLLCVRLSATPINTTIYPSRHGTKLYFLWECGPHLAFHNLIRPSSSRPGYIWLKELFSTS